MLVLVTGRFDLMSHCYLLFHECIKFRTRMLASCIRAACKVRKFWDLDPVTRLYTLYSNGAWPWVWERIIYQG